MPELAIIADDLTGALDAAAPFAVRGMRTAVALRPTAMRQVLATGATIISVSTDSREMPPQAAARAVKDALAQIPTTTPIFKKIDSRLKGNIAAELGVIPHRKSLVSPAIPAFGRWVKDKKLGGFGVQEPLDIVDCLGRYAAFATIPDTTSQAEIERSLVGDFDLWVGARGLGEALAKSMAPVSPLSEASFSEAPIFCVIGSTDPITLTQLSHLRAAAPDLCYIAAPNGVLPNTIPARAQLTVLHAVDGDVKVSSARVATSLGDSLKQIGILPGSLLVLSGGATAQTVLHRLDVEMLELVGEAVPGLPLARAGDLTVITKSGGFGDPHTLAKLLTTHLNARNLEPSHG